MKHLNEAGRRLARCFHCPDRPRKSPKCPHVDTTVAELARDLNAQCPAGHWTDRPTSTPPNPAPQAAGDALPVAVVIVSHNYGEFLAEAIRSAIDQTQPPAEIVVVDDASTDDTAAVAAEFRDRVRYVRIDARDVHQARRAGYEATRSPLIVFLDADDRLAPDYLERGMPHFADRNVAAVLSDWARFGAAQGLSDFPAETDRYQLRRENVIHCAAIVRRDAIETAQVFAGDSPTPPMPEDFWMWRRISDQGFRFVKQSALLHYRKHGDRPSATDRRRGEYFDVCGLQDEPVSLLMPLAGRSQHWPRMADWLDQQGWPHDQTRLVLMDTSGDARFHRQLRRWCARTDYADVRILRYRPAPPGLAERPRTAPGVADAVNFAMCRIYNRLRDAVDAPWTFILEDDVFPPPDVIGRLLRSMRPNVGTVSAPYISRQGYWILWTPDGERVPNRRKGVHEITAAGFGCVLMRSEILRDHVFSPYPGERWFDPSFYRRATTNGWKHLVDWTAEADHAAAPRAAG